MKPLNNVIRRQNQKGASMVEMALCMPVLLMFLFGAADFGRVFFTAIEVANAAAAGAYYGSYSTANMTNTSGISTAATNEGADIANLTVTSSQVCQDSQGNSVSCATTNAYQYVKVTTSTTFQTLFSYPLIPQSVALSKTVMMRAK
jgi:Flp pilus assembly protein TadG